MFMAASPPPGNTEEGRNTAAMRRDALPAYGEVTAFNCQYTPKKPYVNTKNEKNMSTQLP
jgi:hypothetical protein